MALSQLYHYYLSIIYTYYYYKLQLYVKKRKNICNSWANKWKSESESEVFLLLTQFSQIPLLVQLLNPRGFKSLKITS